MATRRTTKVEVPIPPTSTNGDAAPKREPDTTIGASSTSPFLPTLLETALLAIYPGTLLLGSLFSILHPASRSAPYSPTSQSYLADHAPSYFAKKSNVFNVYFVKIGWFWTTLAFAMLLLSHSSLGPPFGLAVTKRRVQAAARYVAVTLVWVGVTQWFFGPPVIDRGFRWTGGKCEVVLQEGLGEELERGDVGDAFTHAACKAIGGQWKGGHDISGHVFLLILGSAMLWLELLPAVLRMEGLREARRVLTADGLVRSAAIETKEQDGGNMKVAEELGIGIKVALTVAGLSWWMLLMTAAYFHTWFEKLTGLMVAFVAIYTVYFLPRGLPALRKVVGMPGV